MCPSFCSFQGATLERRAFPIEIMRKKWAEWASRGWNLFPCDKISMYGLHSTKVFVCGDCCNLILACSESRTGIKRSTASFSLYFLFLFFRQPKLKRLQISSAFSFPRRFTPQTPTEEKTCYCPMKSKGRLMKKTFR